MGFGILEGISSIVKNYMTGGLLWYGHKCMHRNDVVVDELYEETAKLMEGFLAECYKEAKEEGCRVEVVWQDGLKKQFPEAKVYKCGGPVGGVHILIT